MDVITQPQKQLLPLPTTEEINTEAADRDQFAEDPEKHPDHLTRDYASLHTGRSCKSLSYAGAIVNDPGRLTPDYSGPRSDR